MSWTEANDPASAACQTPAIHAVIDSRPRRIDDFAVRRVLPSAARRAVGPFVFFDHMGPADLAPGAGLDVRPHPHINLATITYLFEGEILHRDSLGSAQPIGPGAVNWMTAGKGIAHSERTPPELRLGGSRLHGLQIWVALPKALEETDPAFDHYPAEVLPCVNTGGASVRVLAGSAYGAVSPVRTLSRLVYVEATMPAGAELEPFAEPERAAYVVQGEISCGGERADAGRMLVFAPGGSPVVRAETEARIVLVGGAPLDGPRHVWWNFVSSSRERIERAKADWRDGKFQKVAGDEADFIPLPDDA